MRAAPKQSIGRRLTATKNPDNATKVYCKVLRVD